MRPKLVTRAATLALGLAPLLLVTACASRSAPAGTLAPSTAVRVHPTAQSTQLKHASTANISQEIRKSCGIADEDAYFPFDSSSLTTTDVRPLSAIAKCFSVGPLAGHTMQLVGHADPRGAAIYNEALGMGRADSVEQYLDHHGVQQAKIKVTSRGATDATGHDQAGWAHDRRVDVTLGS